MAEKGPKLSRRLTLKYLALGLAETVAPVGLLAACTNLAPSTPTLYPTPMPPPTEVVQVDPEPLIHIPTLAETIEQEKGIRIVDMTTPEGQADFERIQNHYKKPITAVPWDDDRLNMLFTFLTDVFVPPHFYEPRDGVPVKFSVAYQPDNGVIDLSPGFDPFIVFDANMFSYTDIHRSLDAVVHELTHLKRNNELDFDNQEVAAIWEGDYSEKRQEYLAIAEQLPVSFDPAEKYMRSDIKYALSYDDSRELIAVLATMYLHGREVFDRYLEQVFGLEKADKLYVHVGMNVFRGRQYEGYPIIFR